MAGALAPAGAGQGVAPLAAPGRAAAGRVDHALAGDVARAAGAAVAVVAAGIFRPANDREAAAARAAAAAGVAVPVAAVRVVHGRPAGIALRGVDVGAGLVLARAAAAAAARRRLERGFAVALPRLAAAAAVGAEDGLAVPQQDRVAALGTGLRRHCRRRAARADAHRVGAGREHDVGDFEHAARAAAGAGAATAAAAAAHEERSHRHGRGERERAVCRERRGVVRRADRLELHVVGEILRPGPGEEFDDLAGEPAAGGLRVVGRAGNERRERRRAAGNRGRAGKVRRIGAPANLLRDAGAGRPGRDRRARRAERRLDRVEADRVARRRIAQDHDAAAALAPVDRVGAAVAAALSAAAAAGVRLAVDVGLRQERPVAHAAAALAAGAAPRDVGFVVPDAAAAAARIPDLLARDVGGQARAAVAAVVVAPVAAVLRAVAVVVGVDVAALAGAARAAAAAGHRVEAGDPASGRLGVGVLDPVRADAAVGAAEALPRRAGAAGRRAGA